VSGNPLRYSAKRGRRKHGPALIELRYCEPAALVLIGLIAVSGETLKAV